MKYIKILLPLIFLTSLPIFTYVFIKFWGIVDQSEFENLKEYSTENISGTFGKNVFIHKAFESDVILLDSILEKHALKMTINQAYRHKSDKVIGAIVPPSKISNHLAGYALDFILIDEKKRYFATNLSRTSLSSLPQNIQSFFKEIRTVNTLRWGGDFNREDPIHIDYPLNIKNRKLYHKRTNECFEDYTKAEYLIEKWGDKIVSKIVACYAK